MGVLVEKTLKPDENILKGVLGPTYKFWIEIKEKLQKEYGPLTEEWKYYGAKMGWTMKFLYKKRNLFFLGPYEKYFVIGFVFGDKAVAEVAKSNLPENIIEELLNAKKYAEGRLVSIEVRKKADAQNVLKLTAIKVKN